MLVLTWQCSVFGIGFRFYRSYFFLVLFCQLLLELTERNSTNTCCMFGSEPDLEMRIKNLGCPLPLIQGSYRSWKTEKGQGESQGKCSSDWNVGKCWENFSRLVQWQLTILRHGQFVS